MMRVNLEETRYNITGGYIMLDFSEKDLYWLAGYLEGEGSFIAGSPSDPNNPGISVCSTDEDVIRKVARLFGVNYCQVRKNKKNINWKKVWAVKKRGFHAVELMQSLKPLMGLRRQHQIDVAVASYDFSKKKRLSESEVAEIRNLCTTNIKQAKIAAMFGTSRETVNKIKNFRDCYKRL
jgi:DNA-binding transcriptional regulator YiaG